MTTAETVEAFRQHLVTSRGMARGTAQNYAGLIKKLVTLHPEGANHEQMVKFMDGQRGTHVESACSRFADWILEEKGLTFQVKPPTFPEIIRVSPHHTVLAAILGNLDTPIPLTVAWSELPPIEEWRFKGNPLDSAQQSGITGTLRILRQLGKGSPLVFAKIEGTLVEAFTQEEVENG